MRGIQNKTEQRTNKNKVTAVPNESSLTEIFCL